MRFPRMPGVMSLKRLAARVTAVLFGVVFCLAGVGGSGAGVWFAVSGGRPVLGTALGVFGLPFVATGAAVGYMGLTGQVTWGSGDVDMPVGHLTRG